MPVSRFCSAGPYATVPGRGAAQSELGRQGTRFWIRSVERRSVESKLPLRAQEASTAVRDLRAPLEEFLFCGSHAPSR